MSNSENVAYCGLYCGACKKFIKGSCHGCQKNEKASWCGIRKCCLENNYKSCADCTQMPLKECKKFNNFIGKIFALIFSSNRAKCIETIKTDGYEKYANDMHTANKQTLK